MRCVCDVRSAELETLHGGLKTRPARSRIVREVVEEMPIPPFDFRRSWAELSVTGNLHDCHANVPLIADAGLRAMLPANMAHYAGSTAGWASDRFFALGSG